MKIRVNWTESYTRTDYFSAIVELPDSTPDADNVAWKAVQLELENGDPWAPVDYEGDNYVTSPGPCEPAPIRSIADITLKPEDVFPVEAVVDEGF